MLRRDVPSGLMLLVASGSAIIVITLRPMGGTTSHQLRPFVTIVAALASPFHRDFLIDVVGNTALFMPLGASLRLLGIRSRRANLVGALASAAIEVAQHWIPGRTSSVDDVILNTAGTALGFAAAVVPYPRLRR